MKTTLCHKHDEILGLIKKMDRIKHSDYDTSKDLLDEIKWYVGCIFDLAIEAKEDGQKMENRLRDYRIAIESLGFTRNK